MSIVYVVSKAKNGVTFKNYGVTFNPVKILVSILVALITCPVDPKIRYKSTSVCVKKLNVDVIGSIIARRFD